MRRAAGVCVVLYCRDGQYQNTYLGGTVRYTVEERIAVREYLYIVYCMSYGISYDSVLIIITSHILKIKKNKGK